MEISWKAETSLGKHSAPQVRTFEKVYFLFGQRDW
jgi:hypothetical protein